MTKQTTVPRRSANMSHALRTFEIDSSAIASYNSVDVYFFLLILAVEIRHVILSLRANIVRRNSDSVNLKYCFYWRVNYSRPQRYRGLPCKDLKMQGMHTVASSALNA